MKIYRIKTIFVLLLFGLVSLVSCIREDDTPVKVPPIVGAIISPDVGGATEPNQVWINLSDGKQTTNKRDSWDLAFYSGEEFRVVLNSSIMMAVGEIENATDLNFVTPEMVNDLKTKVQVGNFTANEQYIDDPSGNYLKQKTGIAEIKLEDSENAVYLLNMGRKLYTGTVLPNGVFTGGEGRGWKKIKILRHTKGYKIQYADLEATSYQEIIVEKNSDYHFQFVNLETQSLVNVQPKKKDWDLCFTVFTNLIQNPAISAFTSYIFPDMVLNNRLSNVQIYQVKTTEIAYEDFKKEHIKETLFIKDDQRAIGSNWRTTTGPNGAEVFTDRFFILKNADGFYFKIKFLRMKNEESYRGFPQFEYEPL
ncbi:MAG: HmuY family protein [Cruoricaptor ignavus]|nr:HmuY family protein [Cruoricaptor ignavus]